ncbi:MAG: acyl-CoA reductase [Pseudopedobacter saltans]|uniref:Acyl-CoA reductase n=1 Tax=Pseudopedobacter saltans TaxID=151895 RepID=A0A2W5F7M3_9SPHI|nr:MAG: acyl-CoA reductase [Pseudopedobacter saltans]
MNLQQRISILVDLGRYMLSETPEWQSVKETAFRKNFWFTVENINLSCQNIAENFLQKTKLENWADQYHIPQDNEKHITVGIVMAGNIPLVGFHDFLCTFIFGLKQRIKLSSKDDVLLPFLIKEMAKKNPDILDLVSFEDNLKGCDAYIATGSNNAGRYFDYYFGKYPSIIRRNRTSVALLTGKESNEELGLLAEDIQNYFGLGCRNVTMLYVPENYDFIPLIEVLKKYEPILDYHKYKNNYDYQLAILLLNKKFYMSGGGLLLEENPIIFSPISTIHYQYYKNIKDIETKLNSSEDVQAIVGTNHLGFGQAQKPLLTDYADGVDTMQFLSKL